MLTTSFEKNLSLNSKDTLYYPVFFSLRLVFFGLIE